MACNWKKNAVLTANLLTPVVLVIAMVPGLIVSSMIARRSYIFASAEVEDASIFKHPMIRCLFSQPLVSVFYFIVSWLLKLINLGDAGIAQKK